MKDGEALGRIHRSRTWPLAPLILVGLWHAPVADSTTAVPTPWTRPRRHDLRVAGAT